MVYRNKDGSIIKGSRKETCEAAEQDVIVRTDAHRVAVDADQYSISFQDLEGGPNSEDSCQSISWGEVASHPEPHPRDVFGWFNFLDGYEDIHGPELMLMADGGVYSHTFDSPTWGYEFDVKELGEEPTCDDCEQPSNLGPVLWPRPWLAGRRSEYADLHPARLERARVFDTEYDFFIEV